MDFLNELFGSEMGELKRHQKVSATSQPCGHQHSSVINIFRCYF